MSLQDDWSTGWIPEGHFVKWYDSISRVHRYGFVERREYAHYEYVWDDAVAVDTLSGTVVIANLELTVPLQQIWQLIFGIKHKGYLYVWLPAETFRHGVAKLPRTTSIFYAVGHYEEWMSPWDAPDWITEHFLIRPITDRIAVSYYNTNAVEVTQELNFFINKMDLELLGYEVDGKLTPSKSIYKEVLDKLYRKVIPHRPITLMPVRQPAEAP